MQKGCRVSRNIRASWYFKHLNSKIQFKLHVPQELPVAQNELSLVSVIPPNGEKLDPDQKYNVCIQPHTFVTFLASIYRLAFVLDISPSVFCVDLFKNQVMYDDLLNTLNNCIRGLVKPFQIPGCNVIFKPELYVTVMLQTPVIQSKSNQVLIQGVQITEKNVEHVLHLIQDKLKIFELSLYQSSKSILNISDMKGEMTVEDDGEDIKNPTTSDLLMTPEAGFVNMIRYGILSLQLLPENSSAGVIVLTDGLVGLPEANLFERLLTQLRNSTISCSFLKIGSNEPNHQQFGHVAHVELMQFIATATFGAYIASCPKLDDSHALEPNIYHKALYFWNFQKGLEGFKYELTHQSDEDVPGSLAWINRKLYSNPLDSKRIGLDNVRKKHVENSVSANINSVLSLRLREGYTIKEVQIIQGGSIMVKMVLPWREYVRIEYIAMAAWPLDQDSHKTNIELHIEGSYSFLHEITCQKLHIKSPYRSANVKRFWQAIQSVNQTDKWLAHLQSFSTNSNYYTIPDSIRNGIPLFVASISNQKTGITLNNQLNSSDSYLAIFESFWRPIIMLDTTVWQKWMHCHLIGLVMEHDMPLPKYLHIPNSSGRFHSIACMQAQTELNKTLREWTTFVLRENMSYIKLLFSDPDKPPSYFCVLRVTLKGPCVVLRLAFLGGTPSHLRIAEVEELLLKIKELKFPPRGSEKTLKKEKQVANGNGSKKKKKRKTPLMRDWSEINCCIIFSKPVEKILIRYDRVPKDMMSVDDPNKEETFPISSFRSTMSNSTKSATSMFRMLSHYLCHQRWIWTIQQSFNIPVEMSFIGKVLQTLTKLRLQEGFHFAATDSGIVSFVLEVDMTDPDNYIKDNTTVEYENCSKCVVQYVIFPPHVKTTRDSVSEDDIEEMETTEADFELQIVTECWVEPQYGVCVNNTPECKHLDGLKADQMAKAFFPVDYECISSLVTYDHLVYLCHNKIAFTVPDIDDLDRSAATSVSLTQSSPSKRNYTGSENAKDETEPQCIPFTFDLLSLLPWSQQAELLFSTFIMENNEYSKDPMQRKASNIVLYNLLMEDLAEYHDRQVPMTLEDSQKFLDLLKNRERDLTQNPLPFKFGVDKNASSDEIDFNLITENPEGIESPLTPDKDAHTNRNDQPTSETIQKDPVPRWICFAKAWKEGNLSLTFLPASFDDLLLLNQIHLPKAPPIPEEHLPDINIQEPDDTEADLNCGENKSKGGSITTSIDEAEDSQHQPHKIPVLQRLDSEDPSSVSSSKEEEIAEWINTNSLQCRDGPLLIPIYAYSCSQCYISDSLIQKMDYHLPEDKFEDLSFEVDELSEKYGKCPIIPRTHLTSMMESDDSQKEDDSHYSKRGLMTLDSRSKDHRKAAVHEFKHLRRNISRIFFSCFVKGVFRSLQQHLSIHQCDLDNAINNICEESLPLESEITTFLHSSCGHLQHLVNRARKQDAASKDESSAPRRLSVRFEGLPIEDNESESDTMDRTPVILQFPKTTISLSNLVALDKPCEHSSGLSNLLSEKFLEITKKWFRPVPSNPDYYYYFPEEINLAVAEEENLSECSDASIDEIEQEGEEEEDFFGDFVDVTVTRIDDDGHSMSLESSIGASDADLELAQLDDVPLFIHFTCTLKNRLEQYNVSARSLPHCIGQILRPIEEEIKDFDLSNLKFTFDINCLTLPSDSELIHNKSLIRMLSNNSPEPSTPADRLDTVDADMSVVSSDQGLKEAFGDPISHLQKIQYKAMMAFKQEIEWLLNDEIVSALRHLSPINSDALEFVTEHIKKYKAENKPGCDHHVVSLKFVFGANQSLVRFTEEFERLNLPNYSLTKEGDYYFVILNRNQSINILQAEEIAHALVNLSRTNMKAEKPAVPELPKIFPKLEERSNSLPTLFPMNDSSELPSFDVNKVNRDDNDCDDDDDEIDDYDDDSLRPRSRSDAKYLRRSVSGLSEEGTSLTQTLSEIQHALPLFTSTTKAAPQPHGILKKSSSFASFETGTVNATDILPTIQQSHFKSSTCPPVTDKIRSRHFSAPSGPGTPQSRSSTLPISSRGSCNEDGYEGDSNSSDGELDDTHSVSDGGQSHPQLPNFWLILQIHQDKAEIFFHARDTPSSENNEEELRERNDRRALQFHVKQDIQCICKKVNQRLLLKELNDTRICNSLLVDEAEEDRLWADKRTTSGRSMVESTASECDDDESEDGRGRRYLAARLELMPGHFACDCTWKTMFILHTRLKEGTKRGGGASRGLLALRSVLSKLSVNNRKNMFVIKETQTENVSYLRLRELRNVPVAATSSGDMLEDDYLLQEQSSGDLFAVATKLEESSSFRDKIDADAISNYSGLSRLSSRVESVVELLVYGIEEPGSEVKDSLVRALQYKLDEAVLDVISLMLSRNPKCKLKAEDVRFIQNMEDGVSKVIQLSIPAHAMMYLFALMYYLRQNLLQFLHTPNYDSNDPEDQFQDVINDEYEAIKRENVFLYIRPPASGKGIACISVSLVDSTGSPVKVLNCPYPTSMTTSGILSSDDFDQLLHTVRHEPSPDTTKPGPTALIQFKIWDRFNNKSEMKNLIDKLTSAVKHALCDVILEFNLLTAPICHIPRSHSEPDLLHSSVPSSPVSPKGDKHDRRHSIIGKRFSDSLQLKPIVQSASPLQSLKNRMPSKSKFSTPPPQSSLMFEFPDTAAISTTELPSLSREVSPTSSPLKEVRMKYESGQRGNLHTVYPSVLRPFINYCSKLGTPSINRFELNLLSMFSVDYALKEIQNILPTIASNLTFTLFKLVDKQGELLTGVQYFPCRSPVQPAEDNMETSLDAARKKLTTEKDSPEFLILGRDVDQWRSVVLHENMDSEFPSTKNLGNQKYQPYVFIDQGSTDALSHFRAEQEFVPRQNLLLMFIQGKQITVSTYNWASDLFNSLESHITKLVQWQNARAHLLDSVISQKMGLFHHKTFNDLPYTLEQNPYTQSTHEKEVLIRNMAPPRENQRRHGSISVRDKNQILDHIPHFDDIYKDEQPHIPMHKNNKIPPMKDPVYVHGVQALEIRSLCLKDAEKFNKLSQLHNSWLIKTPGNPAVNEDHLKLLKQSSRLFHYCATPILFSSQWRHRVVEKTKPHGKQDTCIASTPPMTDLPKSRSRHSSGASITSLKNKRSESQDGSRRKMNTPQESPEVRQHGHTEEQWHVELRESFNNQYISYLQNLGFRKIHVQCSARKRASRGKSSDGQNLSTDDTSLGIINLQKTLTAGIILMEISYREEFFCVKLFVLYITHINTNINQQSAGAQINQQMRLLFVDECQKYKDLIHVHSFAHDFHLRCIQRYISGEDCVFHQGFHLTNFLTDFSNIYSYPPSFSRNCLQHESVVLPDKLCSSDDVFEYMIKQMKHYNMKVIKMKAFFDYDVEPDYCFVKNDEFALVRNRKLTETDKKPTVKEADDYDVGIIITQDSLQNLKPGFEADKTTLRLKYFLLLTRRSNCFPMKNLEKRLGGIHPRLLALPTETSPVEHNEPMETESVRPVPVKQHIGVRQEMVDYLGYSNKHQTSIYQLSCQEMNICRSELEEMVCMSKEKCCRDLLWKRMLVQVEDDQKKRRRTADVDEIRDSNMVKLSFEEFQELLKMVNKNRTPLSDEDAQLIPLCTMPLQWYRSLVPVLMSKYPTQHRTFTSTDGQNQCILILNPNFLEMFIMLEITPNKADLCVVMQDPISDQEHTPTTPNISLLSMQSHIEDFVNTCCFHLWSTML
ncbi:KICSTOR complex protein SZT2 [Patella vulgata]|uniref:KICSTOR complex protein SZT2 n=1 Tax=Patella vulgata TaxID=6465 RepID=UPI0024A841B5|nr:KICSTOR complex protein SZT2 [Patella vulgata]